MKRPLLLIVAAALVAGPVACTQIDRAVKGSQSGPGGWTMKGQAPTAMTSDVEYLGASADGLIVVRVADGTAQVWKAGR